MAKILGTATPVAAPAAVRVGRPGWRDPRLWLGVLIVAVCVVVGARLFAGADDTVEVWALRGDHAAGSVISPSDLVVHRVHFADGGDLAGYFRASDTLPRRLILVRDVDGGELLPRGAVGDDTGARLAQLPVSVGASGLPAGLGPGSTVDVYVVGRPAVSGERDAVAAAKVAPVLSDVTVVDVADDDLDGGRTLTLAVPPAGVAAYFASIGQTDGAVVTVVGRP